MVKRFCTVILVILILCFEVFAYAEEIQYSRLVIQQVDEEMPDINVYVDVLDSNGESIDDISFNEENTTILLDGKKMQFSNAVSLKDSDIGTLYFFLVDVSGSVKGDFPEIKDSIKNWAFTMKESDRVALITFGKEVKTVLKGNESKEDILKSIDDLSAGDNKTLFFDAVYKTLDLIVANDSELPQRKVMICITDGEDYSNGGVTSSELSNRLQACDIPFYSIAINRSEANGISKLGELSRSTEGKLVALKPKKTASIFEKLKEEIETGYLITCKSDSNIVDGQDKKINIDVSDEEFSLSGNKLVEISSFKKDTVKPTVVSTQTDKKKEIVLKFNEEVIGADNISNYRIVSEDGKTISIESAAYSNKEAKLILSNDILSGENKLYIENIHDISMENNLVSNSEITIKVIPEKIEEKEENYDWVKIVIVIIAIILVIVLIIILLNKRKRENGEGYPEGPGGGIKPKPEVNSGYVEVCLEYIDDEGEQNQIKEKVYDKLVLGRSKEADIRFNDEELSRKHCRLINQGGILYVEDLNSTNNTKVNGEIIYTATLFEVGDILEIGSQRLEYIFG